MSSVKVALIAGSEKTMIDLIKQLKEYTGDEVEVRGYSIDTGIDEPISEGLVIISSQLAKDELVKLGLLDLNTEHIVARRTISYDHLDKVVEIPQNTKVLLVNDVERSSVGVIEHLKSLGAGYIRVYCLLSWVFH